MHAAIYSVHVGGSVVHTLLGSGTVHTSMACTSQQLGAATAAAAVSRPKLALHLPNLILSSD